MRLDLGMNMMNVEVVLGKRDYDMSALIVFFTRKHEKRKCIMRR